VGIHAVTRRYFGGPLPAGQRVAAGTVGYLGDLSDLTTLNPGDTPPGGWSASWDGNSLVVDADDVTISGYRITGEVVFTGGNPTVTGCRIEPRAGAIYGVTVNGAGLGTLTVSDTTVVGNPTSGTQNNGISSDSGLHAARCAVSRTGDGIHIVPQPDVADSTISQCWVHDLAFIDEEQHLDGIQVFPPPVGGGQVRIEHTRIEAAFSALGTPMNASITIGSPTNNSDPLTTPAVVNCYLGGGLGHLRVNFRCQNATVTDNDFGPLDPEEFELVSWEGSTIAAWSNNRDDNGDLVPQPS
jgi:hypothetical protein